MGFINIIISFIKNIFGLGKKKPEEQREELLIKKEEELEKAIKEVDKALKESIEKKDTLKDEQDYWKNQK